MKSAVLVLVAVLIDSSLGLPAETGVYAYQDTEGNRYSGTYNVKDGQAFDEEGRELDLPFQPGSFGDFDSFFPEFFRNFESSLEEVFQSNLEDQKKAFEAATRAFEMTSNEAGYVPNMIPRPGQLAARRGMNSAFAAGFVSPFQQTQMASISPSNPMMKNVFVSKSLKPKSGPGVYSVSSKASASSSNVNGHEVSNRFSETMVNNNGKISTYTVHS